MAPRKPKRKPRARRPTSSGTAAPRNPAPSPAPAEKPLGAAAEVREPWSRWAIALLVLIVAVFQVLLGLVEYLLQHDSLVFDLVNPQSVPLVVSFALWAPLARMITGERRMGIIEALAVGFLVGICLTLAEFVGYPALVGSATRQAPPTASATASPNRATPIPSVTSATSPRPAPSLGVTPSPSPKEGTSPGGGGGAAATPPESVQLEAIGISNAIGYVLAVLLYPTVFRGWLVLWRGRAPASPKRNRPSMWRRMLGSGKR